LKIPVQKRDMGLCKNKKMDTKMSKILKTLSTKMPAMKKRKKNKKSLALTKIFQVSTREIYFKEHSRIRLVIIYIHYIYPHTCTS